MYYIVRYDARIAGRDVTYAYRNLKDARKELYKTLMAKNTATEGTIYQYRDSDPRYGKVIGKGFVSHFGPEIKSTPFMVVDRDSKKYVLYVNRDTNASKPHTYYLDPDGTLGKRRL